MGLGGTATVADDPLSLSLFCVLHVLLLQFTSLV